MVDRLNTTTTRYKMEIGPDKTKVMTNNPNGFQREIKIKGQRLEVVENLGSLSLMKDKNQRLSFQYCRASSCFYTKDHMEGQKSSLAFGVKVMRTLINLFYVHESMIVLLRRIHAIGDL